MSSRKCINKENFKYSIMNFVSRNRLTSLLALMFLAACSTSNNPERIERQKRLSTIAMEIQNETLEAFFKYCWATVSDHGRLAALLINDGFTQNRGAQQIERKVFVKGQSSFKVSIWKSSGSSKFDSCSTKYNGIFIPATKEVAQRVLDNIPDNEFPETKSAHATGVSIYHEGVASVGVKELQKRITADDRGFTIQKSLVF